MTGTRLRICPQKEIQIECFIKLSLKDLQFGKIKTQEPNNSKAGGRKGHKRAADKGVWDEVMKRMQGPPPEPPQLP